MAKSKSDRGKPGKGKPTASVSEPAPLTGNKLKAFLAMETSARPKFETGQRMATVKAVYDKQGRDAADELAKRLAVNPHRRKRWFKDWAQAQRR